MRSPELKRLGLRVTLPRIKILHLLEAAKEPHMSAEDVYQALLQAGEKVGLATVYRVLTQFAAANLVKRHNFADGRAVYELNQKIHHDHLVCIKCAKIQEFVDEIIEAQQLKVAKQAGFAMTDHRLIIYGVCHTCRQI